MICPHCGKPSTAVRGPCSSCHRELGPDSSAEAATGVLIIGESELAASDATVDLPPSLLTEPSNVRPSSQPPQSSPPPEQGVMSPATGEGTGTPARGMRPVATGPLVPGEAFGVRYHVIRLLGAGGMGAVYQAWDEELGVAVAIKVIKPEVSADPEVAEDLERRFKRELLLARQVTHKNVVRIHDLGDIDGIKYITMPYVQGSDLATVLKKQGKLSVGRALAIARQIASGLGAAHEAGVVHRDLKPENIMIEGEFAMIMDFGIAKALSGTERTMAGAVRGTIGYMAPEQARGEDVDQRVGHLCVRLDSVRPAGRAGAPHPGRDDGRGRADGTDATRAAACSRARPRDSGRSRSHHLPLYSARSRRSVSRQPRSC